MLRTLHAVVWDATFFMTKNSNCQHCLLASWTGSTAHHGIAVSLFVQTSMQSAFNTYMDMAALNKSLWMVFLLLTALACKRRFSLEQQRISVSHHTEMIIQRTDVL